MTRPFDGPMQMRSKKHLTGWRASLVMLGDLVTACLMAHSSLSHQGCADQGQGSCTSLILAVYFTSSMLKAIQEGVTDKVQDNPALRQKLMQGSATLLPPTLYIDDGSLSASAEN